MFGIGAGELVMIFIAGLIIFGPSELPKVGRAIGKGLREFKKAQAALTATLDEVSLESEKKVSTEKAKVENVAEEKISAEKVSIEKNSAEKISALENVSAEETPPHSALTVDDVINLAKENPINKENVNEKNSIDTVDNSVAADANAGDVDSRSNSNGVGK